MNADLEKSSLATFRKSAFIRVHPRFLLLLLPFQLLHAQDTSPLDSAEQSLSSHLPEVAIVKLNAFLTSSAALDDALRERAEQDLTRAMLDSGDAVGALARLEFPSSDVERFWKAEALSSLGQWDDAAPPLLRARRQRPRPAFARPRPSAGGGSPRAGPR